MTFYKLMTKKRIINLLILAVAVLHFRGFFPVPSMLSWYILLALAIAYGMPFPAKRPRQKEGRSAIEEEKKERLLDLTFTTALMMALAVLAFFTLKEISFGLCLGGAIIGALVLFFSIKTIKSEAEKHLKELELENGST